jgi:hypothetical protein
MSVDVVQINFILWLQSFRSPLLDAFFTAVNATAGAPFIFQAIFGSEEKAK